MPPNPENPVNRELLYRFLHGEKTSDLAYEFGINKNTVLARIKKAAFIVKRQGGFSTEGYLGHKKGLLANKEILLEHIYKPAPQILTKSAINFLQEEIGLNFENQLKDILKLSEKQLSGTPGLGPKGAESIRKWLSVRFREELIENSRVMKGYTKTKGFVSVPLLGTMVGLGLFGLDVSTSDNEFKTTAEWAASLSGAYMGGTLGATLFAPGGPIAAGIGGFGGGFIGAIAGQEAVEGLAGMLPSFSDVGKMIISEAHAQSTLDDESNRILIIGLKKADVLLHLYNNAKGGNIGGKGELKEAEEVIKESGHDRYDYVDLGAGPRSIKVDLSGFDFDSTAYDLDYGEGSAQQAMYELSNSIIAESQTAQYNPESPEYSAYQLSLGASRLLIDESLISTASLDELELAILFGQHNMFGSDREQITNRLHDARATIFLNALKDGGSTALDQLIPAAGSFFNENIYMDEAIARKYVFGIPEKGIEILGDAIDLAYFGGLAASYRVSMGLEKIEELVKKGEMSSEIKEQIEKLKPDVEKLSAEEKLSYIEAATEKAASSAAPMVNIELAQKYVQKGKIENAFLITRDSFRLASITADIFGEPELGGKIAGIGSGLLEAGMGIAALSGVEFAAALVPFSPLTILIGLGSVVSALMNHGDDESTKAIMAAFQGLSQQIQQTQQLVIEAHGDLKQEHHITHRMIEIFHDAMAEAFNLAFKRLDSLDRGNKRLIDMTERGLWQARTFFETQYMAELEAAELFLEDITSSYDPATLQLHYSNLIALLKRRSSANAVIGLTSGCRELALDDIKYKPTDNVGLISCSLTSETALNQLINTALFARGMSCLSDLLEYTNVSPEGRDIEKLFRDLESTWQSTRSFLIQIRTNPDLFRQMSDDSLRALESVKQAFEKIDQELVKKNILDPERQRAQTDIDYYEAFQPDSSALRVHLIYLHNHCDDCHIFNVGPYERETKIHQFGYQHQIDAAVSGPVSRARDQLKGDLDSAKKAHLQILEESTQAKPPFFSILQPESLKDILVDFSGSVFYPMNNHLRREDLDLLRQLAYKPAYLPLSQITGEIFKSEDIPKEWGWAKILGLGKVIFGNDLVDAKLVNVGYRRLDPSYIDGWTVKFVYAWKEKYRAHFQFNNEALVPLTEHIYHLAKHAFAGHKWAEEEDEGVVEEKRIVNQSPEATARLPELQKLIDARIAELGIALSTTSANQLDNTGSPLRLAVDELTLRTGKFYQALCLGFPELCHNPIFRLLDISHAPWEEKRFGAFLKTDSGRPGFISEGLDVTRETISELTEYVVSAAKKESQIATPTSERQIFEVDRLISKFKSVVDILPRKELERKKRGLELQRKKSLRGVRESLDIYDYDAALKSLAHLNGIYKNDGEIQCLIAMAHLGKGNKKEARYFIEEASRLDPENPLLTEELFQQAGRASFVSIHATGDLPDQLRDMGIDAQNPIIVLEQLDQNIQSTRDGQMVIGEDTYDSQTCRLINFEGVVSTVCVGEKSTLIITNSYLPAIQEVVGNQLANIAPFPLATEGLASQLGGGGLQQMLCLNFPQFCDIDAAFGVLDVFASLVASQFADLFMASQGQPGQMTELMPALGFIPNKLDFQLQEAQDSLDVFDYVAALKLLASLNREYKDNSEIQCLIAQAHLGQGNKKAAQHFLEEAYRLDPENPCLTDELLDQVGLLKTSLAAKIVEAEALEKTAEFRGFVESGGVCRSDTSSSSFLLPGAGAVKTITATEDNSHFVRDGESQTMVYSYDSPSASFDSQIGLVAVLRKTFSFVVSRFRDKKPIQPIYVSDSVYNKKIAKLKKKAKVIREQLEKEPPAEEIISLQEALENHNYSLNELIDAKYATADELKKIALDFDFLQQEIKEWHDEFYNLSDGFSVEDALCQAQEAISCPAQTSFLTDYSRALQSIASDRVFEQLPAPSQAIGEVPEVMALACGK
jgi:hypothetical protein